MKNNTIENANESPNIATSPLASGKVITLSPVGSAANNLVSWASKLEPSNTTALSWNLTLDAKELLSPAVPKKLYISVKFAFILVPADRKVSPVPSFADEPILISCLVIFYPK